MGAAVHQGRTDTTLVITLDPYLLRVSFTSEVVAVGGSIGVEAQLLNVADGASIEFTFLDGNGSKVGTSRGTVHSGVHRSLYRVEKANATGRMLAIAELADYGLKLSGPACTVLPPVRIENPRWLDEAGTKELDVVFAGQRVTLAADVALGPREERIDFAIQARPAAPSSSPDGSGIHAHGQEAPPLLFPYQGRIRDKKIRELFVAGWDVNAPKANLTYTIHLYGVTSEPSKAVKYLNDMKHSG